MSEPVDIYVGNLSREATEDDLRKLFEKSGTVLRVQVTHDHVTNMPRACVTMQDTSQANSAIETLSNKPMHGRALVLILDERGEFFKKYA